ncbi:hypothetical protein [Nocardioides sp. cx-173]|uniref:hypothetical protein n=1 Tax=Nocardioides sp. cx-173 TaxID=2898796 RepID=UPI001E39FBAF|nr:hypothetical protein [Nocardioides sp. cx-173]MCD4525230.1 hypothetical protein [Nocardioides sp. cx-173]UGB40967.1 hypothetical protein LQ940_16515 [Nocardioides sp. cx-173]
MKRLEIVHINQNCVEFGGYSVRELHTQSAGRPPVWNTRTRRWVTSPRRLDDLVALAERRGYAVEITGAPASRSSSAPRVDVAFNPPVGLNDDQPDPGRGLW